MAAEDNDPILEETNVPGAERWAITQCNVRQLIKSLRDDMEFMSPHTQHQLETCRQILLLQCYSGFLQGHYHPLVYNSP